METGWKRKTNWDHMSSSSSVFLDIARWVFSLWHKSPAWQGQRSVQIDFAKNKCILSCTQIFLCKYKQGLATNWKTSGLWNKRTNPFLSSHPNSTAEFIGGFATWAVIQILICSEDRKTCWVKVASQGGSLAKHASLSVANLTLNLLRSTWSSFSFPFWSYSRQTSLLAASVGWSVSQSARVDKSC